jgi:hypothetical protein
VHTSPAGIVVDVVLDVAAGAVPVVVVDAGPLVDVVVPSVVVGGPVVVLDDDVVGASVLDVVVVGPSVVDVVVVGASVVEVVVVGSSVVEVDDVVGSSVVEVDELVGSSVDVVGSSVVDVVVSVVDVVDSSVVVVWAPARAAVTSRHSPATTIDRRRGARRIEPQNPSRPSIRPQGPRGGGRRPGTTTTSVRCACAAPGASG